MRLTTKGRYAVTAMLDLAFHQGEGPITLADIAERQGISLSYLEQLFSRLRKKLLVSSVRGPGGGYVLGKEADEIFIAAVITAVDEKVDTTRCGGSHNCQDNERCLTHDLWHDLSDQIYDYLNRISLHDLMERRGVKKVAQRQDEERRRAAEKAAVSADVKFAATPVGTGVRA
ncbi:Fe-S cluster assembly transcriptional regulator IscR [Sedimenticola hydrogenitrophicus]|uniref:Fe-S cluster assembly transcriptional regulator IscR n=1 Tax=Sedimenticola hydrogenitrophicus TaxID=2967975 RepID=UPI0023B004C6